MSRDKQIEEMARDIEDVCENSGCNYENGIRDCDKCRAEWLYELGYRKSTDLAEEIFAEIEKIIDMHYNNHIFGNNDLDDLEHEAIINFSDDITCDIAELKKKYTKEILEGEK